MISYLHSRAIGDFDTWLWAFPLDSRKSSLHTWTVGVTAVVAGVDRVFRRRWYLPPTLTRQRHLVSDSVSCFATLLFSPRGKKKKKKWKKK